jgi:hypothetical protein
MRLPAKFSKLEAFALFTIHKLRLDASCLECIICATTQEKIDILNEFEDSHEQIKLEIKQHVSNFKKRVQKNKCRNKSPLKIKNTREKTGGDSRRSFSSFPERSEGQTTKNKKRKTQNISDNEDMSHESEGEEDLDEKEEDLDEKEEDLDENEEDLDEEEEDLDEEEEHLNEEEEHLDEDKIIRNHDKTNVKKRKQEERQIEADECDDYVPQKGVSRKRIISIAELKRKQILLIANEKQREIDELKDQMLLEERQREIDEQKRKKEQMLLEERQREIDEHKRKKEQMLLDERQQEIDKVKYIEKRQREIDELKREKEQMLLDERQQVIDIIKQEIPKIKTEKGIIVIKSEDVKYEKNDIYTNTRGTLILHSFSFDGKKYLSDDNNQIYDFYSKEIIGSLSISLKI